MGTGADGARVLSFAPIIRLDDIPINDLIKQTTIVTESIILQLLVGSSLLPIDVNTEAGKKKYSQAQVTPFERALG